MLLNPIYIYIYIIQILVLCKDVEPSRNKTLQHCAQRLSFDFCVARTEVCRMRQLGLPSYQADQASKCEAASTCELQSISIGDPHVELH